MGEIQVPIVRGDKLSNQTDYRDFMPKNMVAIAKEIRGAQGYLISHAGLKKLMTASGECRGGFFNDRLGKHFQVSGSSLITIDSASGYSTIGTINGAGQCSMPYSFQSQLIISGGDVYRYASGALTKLTDPDFGSPIDGDWIDGYYFFTDGEYLYHTTLADETQVAPTDYAVAEIMPDKSLGVMRTPDNLMMVFGRYSTEYFTNDGTSNFAFIRIPQKSLEIGICGTHCKTRVAGNVFILGSRRYESPSIYALGAGDAQLLSTPTINDVLQNMSDDDLASCVLESRTDGDMQMLIVRLPHKTYALNLTAAQAIGVASSWSELSTGVDGGAWIACNGVFNPLLSKWVYGSTTDDSVYALDYTSAAQDGEFSECEFQTPLIYAPTVRVGLIELNTITGFESSNTNVFISVTDNGVTESSEYVQLYGEAGNYNTRFVAFGFGYFNQQFAIKCRVLTKDRVNFSGLKVRYG